MPIRMTITHTIIQAKDFIKITVIGELDLRASKKVLAKLATAAGLPTDYDILLDGRQAHSVVTDSDLLELVDVLCQHRPAFRNKIAVLCPEPKSPKTQFWERSWREAGFEIAFFLEFEEAMNWLNTCVYFHIDYDGETLPDQ